MNSGTPPPKCIAVVSNAASGAFLDSPGASATLPDLLRDAGFAAEFIDQGAGTLPRRIGLAIDSGADMIVVAGGDGTIACAAQQLAGKAIVLGILPFGTMNVLAKDLGIPIGDIAAAVAVLRDGQVREIDAAEVNGQIYALRLDAGPAGPAWRATARRAGGRTRSPGCGCVSPAPLCAPSHDTAHRASR